MNLFYPCELNLPLGGSLTAATMNNAMDQIRALIWDGAINVQVNVKQSLLLNEVSYKESVFNLRIPRDTYLVLYLPAILDYLRNSLRTNTDNNGDGGTYWFEFENVSLYWNYPMGVLYDSMLALNPPGRISKDTDNSINVWKIELAYGSIPPNGLIPLIGGIEQIKSYWMHQWKQSCHILNGSAKQVMSLSMQDSQKFWESILTRDRTTFETVSSKIVPKRPKYIPIIFHQTLPEIKRVQPSATEYKKDGSPQILEDLARSQFPEFFQDNQVLIKAVSNGIEVPLESNVLELYRKLMSFDGFLHISICLVSNEEYLDS